MHKYNIGDKVEILRDGKNWDDGKVYWRGQITQCIFVNGKLAYDLIAAFGYYGVANNILEIDIVKMIS